MIMKKIYSSPLVEVVNFEIKTIMTDGSLNYDKNTNTKIDSKYQGTDEARNDWDNIWGGM